MCHWIKINKYKEKRQRKDSPKRDRDKDVSRQKRIFHSINKVNVKTFYQKTK